MVDTAVAARKLGTLAAALTEAKLANALKDDGSELTVIAAADKVTVNDGTRYNCGGRY